jgi:hypothetical protein
MAAPKNLYLYADAIGLLARELDKRQLSRLDRYAWARLGGGPREYSPFKTWRTHIKKATLAQSKWVFRGVEELAGSMMCTAQLERVREWHAVVDAAGGTLKSVDALALQHCLEARKANHSAALSSSGVKP